MKRFLFILVFFTLLSYVGSSWFFAKKLSNDLIDFVNNVTNFLPMQEEFERTRGEYVEINSTLLINEFVDKIEAKFRQKKEMVMRLKRKAEESYVPYEEGDEVELDENENVIMVEKMTEPTWEAENKTYEFNIMRENLEDNETFSVVPTFSLNNEVNLNNSFVHVPTNVVARSKKIRSIIKWTSQLDDVFRDNFNESDEKILYQYYCHSTGMMRIYPGNLNNLTAGKVDLFDCRGRPWYAQSSNSPKDIVIVIDLSGSMVGQKIAIAKIATAALIDSLDENDFFNVIAVSTKIFYMEDCLEKYDMLFQATKKNKERMKMQVQTLITPGNESNHMDGIKKAFSLLKSGGGNRTHAECNSAIMFFTDGIEGDYAEFKKFFVEHNADKKTRVFTYLVGRVKTPDKEVLLKMAEDNNGCFYKLQTIANIWDTVFDYLQVMSRPLIVQYRKQKPLYSPAYLDSTGGGMVMSCSVPVFSRTPGPKPKVDNFIGVVGTDISIQSLNDLAPHPQLSTIGHMFIISNNGFIIYHPKFRTQDEKLPAPPNILLEDLEVAVNPHKILSIKKEMIDRELDQYHLQPNNTNNTFSVYYPYDHNRQVSIINVTYNYRIIEDTELTAGMVISEGERMRYNFQEDDEEGEIQRGYSLLLEGIKALDAPWVNESVPNVTVSNWTFVKVSPWNYLNITAAAHEETPYSIKTYPRAADIYDYLQGVQDWEELESMVPTNFSTQLLKNILISAAIATTNVLQMWNEETINAEKYESLFVATAAGYSRFFTFSNTTEEYDRDVLNIPIFQHAIANPNANLIFSAPYSEPSYRPEKSWITVVAPVRIGKKSDEFDGEEDEEKDEFKEAKDGEDIAEDSEQKDNRIIIAVTGMIFDPDTMLEYFKNATSEDYGYSVQCAENMTHICALLDTNGYIIASNQGDEFIGTFIGEQSGRIVDLLVQYDVLKKINILDTQGHCKRNDPRYAVGAASFLLTPAKLLFNFFYGIAYNSIHLILFLLSLFQSGADAAGEYVPNIRTSCNEVMRFYFFQRDKVAAFQALNWDKRRIKCVVPRWCYIAVQYLELVPDTNLIFFKAKMPASCVGKCRNIKKILHRNRTDSDFYCNKDQEFADPTELKQKYRKGPESCFQRNPKKEKKWEGKCGRGGAIQPIGFWLLVSLFLSLTRVL